MSDGDDTLQFDSVVPLPLPAAAAAAAGSPGISCAACGTAIHDDYFDVSGQPVCRTCRVRLLEHAEPAKGWGTLARAGLFGLGAAVAGALLYYAVIAITNFEVGLVAIAIGYMVGWSVRRGAGGRGGRRLQVLAVALTYLAVSLAYGALALGTVLKESRQKPPAAAATAGGPAAGTTTVPGATGGTAEAGTGLVYAMGFTLALPIIIVVGSLPGGLLSGAIIAFGLLQAWRLTGVPQLHVSGPYRVGTAPGA